ncbi:MAG: nucleotidyltransferase domain-containing protein [Bacteroidota bacterium]
MTNNQQKYLDFTKEIVLNHIDKDKYAVFLYGSRANGKSWKHSDIDVENH